MNFNLQALEGFSPASIYATAPGVSSDRITFYRNASGAYDFYGSRQLTQTQMKAIPGTSAGRKFTLEDIYKCMTFHGLTLDEKSYEGFEPGYLEFMQAQFEFFNGTNWKLEGTRAAAEFAHLVEPLLHELSLTELMGMKVRQLVNPIRCHATSKGKTGVFVAPAWQDAEHVQLALRVDAVKRPAVRRKLDDWLQRTSLKLTIPYGF